MSIGESNIMVSSSLHPGRLRVPAQAPFRRLNVLFVTLMDLPEGGGNTARLKALLQVVAECGHDVFLLNEHGQGCAPPELVRPAGQIGAVQYRYVLGSVKRRRGFSSI